MATETQPDPRIGKHGFYAPQVCAVTGQILNGVHFTTYKIEGRFYFRVRDGVASFSREAVTNELSALIPKAKSLSAKEVKAHDE